MFPPLDWDFEPDELKFNEFCTCIYGQYCDYWGDYLALEHWPGCNMRKYCDFLNWTFHKDGQHVIIGE